MRMSLFGPKWKYSLIESRHSTHRHLRPRFHQLAAIAHLLHRIDVFFQKYLRYRLFQIQEATFSMLPLLIQKSFCAN